MIMTDCFSDGYANDEIRFQLIDGSKNSVTGLDNIKLAQFELLHFNINIATTKFARGTLHNIILLNNVAIMLNHLKSYFDYF